MQIVQFVGRMGSSVYACQRRACFWKRLYDNRDDHVMIVADLQEALP